MNKPNVSAACSTGREESLRSVCYLSTRCRQRREGGQGMAQTEESARPIQLAGLEIFPGWLTAATPSEVRAFPGYAGLKNLLGKVP
jgi:hypothetical protein